MTVLRRWGNRAHSKLSTPCRGLSKQKLKRLAFAETLEARQLMAADLVYADPHPMELRQFDQTFEEDGEQDHFLIRLDAGEMLYADVDTVRGAYRDSRLSILDPLGTVVYESDDIRDPTTLESNTDPAAMYIAEQSGTYTIVVEAKPADEAIEGTTEYVFNLRNYTLNDGNVQRMTSEIANGDTMAWMVGDSMFLSDEAGNGIKLNGDWVKSVTLDENGNPTATYTNSGPISLQVRLPESSTTAPIAGDSNGDGKFDSSDLVVAFSAGKYNTGLEARYSEGDWDHSGYFDTNDLIFALQQGSDGFTPRAASPLLSASTGDVLGQHGLLGEYYQLAISPSALDQINFDQLTPVHTRVDSNVDFASTTGDFGGFAGPALRDNFAARWTGQIYIDTPGEYTFTSGSDDGSRVYVDGQLVDNNDGLHGFVENGTYAELVAQSNPLNWYRFNETGAEPLTPSRNPPAIDAMGNKHGEKILTDNVAGVIDGAVRLRESGDRVAINAPALTGAWTASFVLQDFGNPNGPSDHLLQDTQYALKLDQFNNSGQLGFTRFGVADYRFSPAATIPRNQFVQVTFVGNPQTGVQVYINGNLAGSNPNYMPLPRGTLGTTGTVGINSSIDEVVLYNRALTAAEIKVQANAALQLTTSAKSVQLSPGFHDIRMEFFEAGGAAGARLRWTRPGSTQREVVPSDVLSPTTSEGGLLGEYYQLGSAVTNLDALDFSQLTPVHTRVDDTVNFPNTNGAFASLGNPALFDRFAARWTGQVYIDSPGDYAFIMTGNDASRLTIDGTVALHVQNDGPATLVASQSTTSFPASNAIDNNPNTFSHTAVTDRNASWSVEFDGERLVDSLTLDNRLDCCRDRLRDLVVRVFDANNNQVFVSPTLNPGNTLNSPLSINVPIPNVVGKRITVSRIANPNDLTSNGNILSFGEVRVSSYPVRQLTLSAGLHDLSVEMFDNSGAAGVRLEWLKPDGTRGFIPAAQLIPANLEQGVYGEYFTLNSTPATWSDINLAGKTPAQSQVLETIDVRNTTANNFAARWTGFIYVDEAGEYQLISGSGDGSRLYVNETLVVDNDGTHDFAEVSSGPLYLTQGLHRLRMEYFEGADGDGARLSWLRPGATTPTVIPATSLYHLSSATDLPDVGNLVLEGQITISTTAGVFGNLAGAVNQMTSDMQVSGGIDPILNYYASEYGLSILTPGNSFGINLGRDLAFLAAPLRDSGIYVWSRISEAAG
ncbi:MAG: discoidin domain-containing protein, partial [Planctomycetales bacterium]|nr:discoidin domain-containing protein [Planctomycetales bacterium]